MNVIHSADRQPLNPPESVSSSVSRVISAETLVILAATAIVAAAVLQAEPLQSANDRSRWATVWSLVERGTYQIDEIDQNGRWSTIDKVRYRANDSEPWHFYSSKPPLLSTLVAGLYAVERWTLGYGLFNHTTLVTRLLLLIVNVLPFLLALKSLKRCLLMLGASREIRLFVLAVAGFGSILNPYLTTLNNHTPAAACAMFAITVAVRILGRDHSTALHTPIVVRPREFVSLGFFAALTCCFELPAAQMGVLAFWLAIAMKREWALKWFLPGAAIPLLAFFVTNWLATGGVKPFYATYGTETYVYVHNGIPSYWSNPRDLDANTESTAMYLFHCVFGHHGMLSLTPVLMITVAGWFVSLKQKRWLGHRFLFLSGAVMTLVTLGFYLTRTENYNYGGNSVGLRWMLWLSPFWWIGMIPALEKVRRWPVRWITALLLVISIVSVSWSLNRPWRPSWLYEQMESAGWINYRTKHKPFDPPRSSVLGRIPEKPGDSMTWRSTDGQRLRLTVESFSDASKSVRLTFELNDSTGSLELDVDAFRLGSSIDDSISVWDAAVPRKISELPQLLRGLPESRNFNSAGLAWVPSRANPSQAWKVDRAAARVFIDDPVLGKCWHRCDIMYCEELPFGVLQWKTTVTSDATGEVLIARTWIAENH